MSYIQINIGGKDRGLKFNQMAVEVYAKNLNLEAIESSSIYATFFAGLVGGCYAKQEEPDFTFSDVVDWVDGLLQDGKTDVLKSVNDCFAETQAFKSYLSRMKDAIEKAVDEDDDLKKKKA